MTNSPAVTYAIEPDLDGTIVERTPAGQAGPGGLMVRCICGYKAGPYAAGAFEFANKVRDKHAAACLWPHGDTGWMSAAR